MTGGNDLWSLTTVIKRHVLKLEDGANG